MLSTAMFYGVPAPRASQTLCFTVFPHPRALKCYVLQCSRSSRPCLTHPSKHLKSWLPKIVFLKSQLVVKFITFCLWAPGRHFWGGPRRRDGALRRYVLYRAGPLPGPRAVLRGGSPDSPMVLQVWVCYRLQLGVALSSQVNLH